jgi:alkylation response protein AidB-like acyl-CoA dehydrogenase
MKVFGSEALDYVVDEAVQIYGGMGFSAEMMIDRGYRDSRINRIFEGTNEINRLLLVDNILKKGARKILPIMEEAEKAFEEVRSGTAAKVPEDYFGEKLHTVANLKKVVLMLIKAVSEKFTRKLVHEQEILSNISDCIIQVYAAESVVLRVLKMEKMKGEGDAALYRDMADVFVYDAAWRIAKYARDTTYSFAYGEVRDLLEKGIAGFTAVSGINVKEARRRIADHLIEENRYCY